MNKKLEILHVLNIISFLMVVAFIYLWQYVILLHTMLGIEIVVFGLTLRYTLILRDHGDDEFRTRLYKKSRWLMMYSIIFMAVYAFMMFRLYSKT